MSTEMASRVLRIAVVGMMVVLISCTSSKGLTLVEDGEARAVLVLSRKTYDYTPPSQRKARRGRKTGQVNPAENEKLAALEIQSHIQKMSGVDLEIMAADDNLKGKLPILIGGAADAKLDDAIRAKGKYQGSFALVVTDESVSIRGLSSGGTLIGAYELLEQLGVRWFMPGDIGLVVPDTKTVTLSAQRTIQVPSFPSRYLQALRAPRWEIRMRFGGPRFPSSHGIHLPEEASFDKHPEYYSLLNGERRKRQLCVSNPNVVKYAVESARDFFRKNPDAEFMGMGANDGRGFCECEKCKALDGGDYDPFGHYTSMTDRYVWLFNQVLEGIKDEFPDKKIGFYAYSVYNRPPVKVKPNRRLVPAVALITICRIHGMNNPICPEKSYEKWIIGQWGKLVDEVYYRGYWFNLADPGLPFFMLSRIAREIPLGKELGIAGWRSEVLYEWAGSCPSRYLACKLMWDHTTDVDALLKDFSEKFFGPAAAPMLRYIMTMDNARTHADYHTGCVWDAPHIYNKKVRAEAHRALDEASRLAPEGWYAKRVDMYRKSFEYLEAFLTMLQARAVHDYATAQNALDKTQVIREELQAHDPPLIGRKAKDYMWRFIAPTIEQGYAKTTGGNELVATMDEVWDFQIDPEQVGESIGWWRPEAVGGNWQKIKTCTSTWSNQGLRYYKGLSWYRQTVEIPERFKGKRVFIWFGAIDERAKVWVNGKIVGISPRITFKPFELDATEMIEAGAPNVVVVCVDNATLNEVGTGGIMGPVMFYAPAAGFDAKLDNVKPLGKTFPEY